MNMNAAPRRLLFIASIGNPAPYHNTRHSAGHLLLDALKPQLETTLPNTGIYHETWKSPSLMNTTGPKLVRRLEQWATERASRLERIANLAETRSSTSSTSTSPSFPSHSTYPTTLVILHDELSIALGKVRVVRGGPETFSLRGHRGLTSICETLRKKGLYPGSSGASKKSVPGLLADLSILRVGLGIGRPSSHETADVSKYVLGTVTDNELKAYHAAAIPVVQTIRDELVRPGGKV